MKDDEPWFVAADVCKVLELEKTDRAVSGLDDDEKGTHIVSTPGGNQSMTVVTEAGLYSLILRSRKPEAKTFKRWVIHDVLPSIRKHGAYLTPETIIDLAIWRVVECFSLGGAERPSANLQKVFLACACAVLPMTSRIVTPSFFPRVRGGEWNT
jgi:prophage antirepressor-like protein